MLALAARSSGRALFGAGRAISSRGRFVGASSGARVLTTRGVGAARTRGVCAAAAAAAVVTTAATTTVALCHEDSGGGGGDSGNNPVNWKLTLGISAAAAVLAGGVAALILGRGDGDGDDSNAQADTVESGRPVHECAVLPMPPRGPLTTKGKGGASSGIVLDNGLGTRVTWGVSSARGLRAHMEDEWCAGIIVPQVVVEGDDDDASDINDVGEAAEVGTTAEDDGRGTAGEPPAKTTKTQAGDPLYVLGVFDGHGGGMCSNWAARNMLVQVGKHISYESQVASPRGVVEAALGTLESQMTGEKAMRCGTTAIVVAVTHAGELVVGNVGDSRAMLCSGAGCDFRGDPALVRDTACTACSALALSEDHKPEGAERERVEAAGGMVAFDGCMRVYLGTEGYRGKGGLAMTRALGDKAFKLAPFVADEAHPLVSAEPDFQARTLTREDSWCILASDGLWDVVSPDNVCSLLSKNVEGHKCDPQVVASELVKFALDRGSSDNVTVLALRFDHGSDAAATGAGTGNDSPAQPPATPGSPDMA